MSTFPLPALLLSKIHLYFVFYLPFYLSKKEDFYAGFHTLEWVLEDAFYSE